MSLTEPMYRRALHVVRQAVRLGNEARPAYLAAACRNDSALADAVQVLLTRYERNRAAIHLEARHILPHEPRDLDSDFQERYELHEPPLGHGSMGMVYKAWDHQFHRWVAVKKVLDRNIGSSELRKRFRQEALAAGRVQHPGIIQVYDLGIHNGELALAMELVPGGSLQERLTSGRMRYREAAVLLERIASAVAAAHEARVIHLDIKPGNVLLTQDGSPKIGDFGIARRLDLGGGAGQPWILGTPGYMAPEQAQGQPNLTPAADVHALGAVLYELLTGRLPFVGATDDAILNAVRTQRAESPRRLRWSIPRDLDAICLKCLQKEPANRYPNAAALAASLRLYLEHRPIPDRRTPAWERATKLGRRHPVWTAVLSMTFLLLGLSGWGIQKYVTDLEVQRDNARAAEALANRRLLQNYLGNGRRLAQEGNLFRSLPWYVAALKLEPNREEVHRLRLSALAWQCPKLVHLGNHPVEVRSASFSPDGNGLVTCDGRGDIRVWDLTGCERLVYW